MKSRRYQAYVSLDEAGEGEYFIAQARIEMETSEGEPLALTSTEQTSRSEFQAVSYALTELAVMISRSKFNR